MIAFGAVAAVAIALTLFFHLGGGTVRSVDYTDKNGNEISAVRYMENIYIDSGSDDIGAVYSYFTGKDSKECPYIFFWGDTTKVTSGVYTYNNDPQINFLLKKGKNNESRIFVKESFAFPNIETNLIKEICFSTSADNFENKRITDIKIENSDEMFAILGACIPNGDFTDIIKNLHNYKPGSEYTIYVVYSNIPIIEKIGFLKSDFRFYLLNEQT